MKNWKQFTFVAIIAIVGIIIGFMACDNNENETTHVHQFGTEWKKDATQHWHECSCGEKADIANHTWAWTVTTPASPTEDGEETRTCSACGEKETRPIEQTEPTKKNFPVSFDFKMADVSTIREAIIQDKRTNCGSASLEEIKVNDKDVVTIIEEAVMGAFNTVADTNIRKNRFRNVFNVEGGVTVYVENIATAYKMKATDVNSIYFHIDYLNSSPTDIQQNIFDAVSAMNGNTELPYNAE